MEKAVTAASLPRRGRQCISGAALMTMMINQCQFVACVYHVRLASSVSFQSWHEFVLHAVHMGACGIIFAGG